MSEAKERSIPQEIKILEQRIRELKEAAGPGAEARPEKEVLREALRERIEAGIPLPPAPVPVAPPKAAPPPAGHDEAKEVEGFVSIAFSQSIPAAVKAVLKSGNAHLIDAFHDVLVDRFYEEFVKLGKLK